MADNKQDTERRGWVEPREPRDEPPAKTLNTEGLIARWVDKASARSGPKYAPGIGKSS